MNGREIFLDAMHFKPVKNILLPALFQVFERETFRRWQREGLPKDIHPALRFGFQRTELIPVHVGPMPHYQGEQLEEIEEWRLGLDREMQKTVVDRVERIERSFPVASEKDWEHFRKLLNPSSPARYPRFWEDYRRRVSGRDYPLGISLGSPFGNLMEWIGIVEMQKLLDTNLGFIQKVATEVAEFLVETTRKAVDEVSPDFAILQEAGAYRGSHLLSPARFRTLMLGPYRKIAEFLRSKNIDILLVEGHGNIHDLIPIWLEAGFNGLCFLDVAAGVDALQLRREYGKALILIGNIDHHTLVWGKRYIEDELASKVPALLEQGGYLPTPDHAVSSDVSLENYEYYLGRLASIGGG